MVTSVNRADHNSCMFHYTVDARDYASTDSCPTDTTSPTDQIDVTYAPEDPSLVTTGNPGNEFRTDVTVLLIGAAGFAVAVTLAVRKLLAAFRTRNDPVS